MKAILRTSLSAVVLSAFLCGAAAAQHDGIDHGAAHQPAADVHTHPMTVNVAVSDAGIAPATVFVPAGHPVQLMLRGRGTHEHHYRVVGLVPADFWWVVPRESPGAVPASDDGHDHHNRQLVKTRATSPAGITPTGHEVHGYVSATRNIDVIVFTATQTGTFEVVCDLHPEHVGRLTVFETSRPAASRSTGLAPAVRAALARDLGRVEYAGVPGIQVEAMYSAEDEQYVAFLLTERLHTASLPRAAQPPDLFLSGEHVPLVDSRVVTDSVHHRATSYRFTRDAAFGRGHQVMTLRLASGQEATWHLPLTLPEALAGDAASAGFGERWALILALLGGMLAAMWPCLFQLTVYFIPALAGVAVQEGGSSVPAGRRQVLHAAFYFILGFTLVYTLTGALIGYLAQRFGDTSQFEAWQRYIGVAAGIVVIGLALRVAAKVRAPLVCRMPILSGMARSKRPATRMEMMLAGLAFATGCMTCFGSALVVGMVVYIGLAQSALYGALVLFLFSLGMGIPLVIAAVAMARALPLLLRLEHVVPWMGLASAILMAGFGTLLISGNYMIVSEWTYRVASGRAGAPVLGNTIVLTGALVSALVIGAWLLWRSRVLRLGPQSPSPSISQ
jgi:cytochrome c-type biogenesis protein